MAANNLLTGLGLFTCIGAMVLVALVAVAMGARSRSPGSSSTTPPNMWREVQPTGPDPAAEERLGVPATGQTPTGSRDQIIGSSGFDVDEQGQLDADDRRFAEGDD